jgi:protein-S-isoprenylcysteine O-methyltransferase Ste14
LVGRAVPAVVFGVVLSVQLLRTWATLGVAARSGTTAVALLAAANSALVLGFYALLVVLFAVRLPRLGGDRRLPIVLASFAGTFLVMIVPFLPGAARRDGLLLPADLLAVAGSALALWSLAHLRRSFSILPQSRRLVTGGPYELSRNPMYLGEFLAWSALLPSIGWAGVAVLAAGVTLQVVRVHAEEQVLARTFGGAYADYRRRVRRWFGKC